MPTAVAAIKTAPSTDIIDVRWGWWPGIGVGIGLGLLGAAIAAPYYGYGYPYYYGYPYGYASYGYPYAYGYGYYGYRGGLYSGPEVQTVRYKVGTANIDVVDAKRKVVVWEGIAEQELTGEIMQNPQPAIDNVVAKMFTQFPGRAAPSGAAPSG